MSDDDALGERLEMLLVMRWLEEGADERGEVGVPVLDAARELGLDDDRAGVLAVMGALGSLEDRGAVRVTWPASPSGHALVVLTEDLRGDARRLFGGPPGPPAPPGPPGPGGRPPSA
ncbi:hypothetical protein [Miltoncostaea marina]|uniref:hypothetical protein n=1 Tax=Miltoncostaea marina TaxID=2843215 RepID=UPI001C3DE809|nr:hypothetical protein [Miltoncostaea marina]